MKTLCVSLFIALLSGVSAPSAQAQQPAPAGYWNLETNLTTRDYTVVRFYNSQHELVHEELLNNLSIDLSKGTGLCRRTAHRLDVALQNVLANPAQAAEASARLAAQLGQNRRTVRVYAVR